MELSEMTFGVEIECYVPVTAIAVEGWRVAGYHSGRGTETNGQFPNWKVEHDGSLRTAPVGMRGIEVISPILKGIDGLNEMTRVIEKIKAMGGKVNQSTGFHVHVGFSNDASALVRLIHLMANVEQGMFATTGSRTRMSSGYCRPVKAAFIGLKNAASGVDTISKIHDAVTATSDKYYALNVSRLSDYRRTSTVEFRLFAGTLNPAKARAYVQLALGLVQLASEDTKRVKWDASPRPYLFTGLPGEAEVKRLFVMLGWTRNASVSYGKKEKAYGVLDPASLRATKKLLIQLGHKFSGGERRNPNVEVE